MSQSKKDQRYQNAIAEGNLQELRDIITGFDKKYLNDKLKKGEQILEVFFDEAKEHRAAQSESMFHSGTWIEQTESEKEYLLKSSATTLSGKQYLLIRLLNNDLGDEHIVSLVESCFGKF